LKARLKAFECIEDFDKVDVRRKKVYKGVGTAKLSKLWKHESFAKVDSKEASKARCKKPQNRLLKALNQDIF
jgi:hypothetical protein